MVDTIKSKAPRWVSILQNSSYPPENQTGEVPLGKFTVILSMLCSHMHRNTSDAFPAIMSLYLFQAGCRRRGIELFNCLGLCKSYRPTRERVLKLCEQGQQKILQLGPNPTTIMTYDNFEYTDGRRGDRLGDKRSFRSITTALIFSGQGIPEEGLRQSMWRPNTPLRTTDVIKKLSRDNLYIHIKRYFIECAIKEALGEADPRLAD